LGGYVENPFFNHLFLHIWALITKVNQKKGFLFGRFYKWGCGKIVDKKSDFFNCAFNGFLYD